MGDRDIAARLTLELGMVDTIGGLGPREKPLERVKSLKKRDGRGKEKLITWTCIVYTCADVILASAKNGSHMHPKIP